jgi:hypothetical protein
MPSGDDRPAVTSPVPRAVWESVLRSDRNAVVTQSLEWRDAVFAGGRYRDVSLLYEFPSGRQVVLPMARHRLAPSNTSIASWPRVWGLGGPISSEGRITSAEAAAVLSDVARRGRLSAAIRLRHDADEAWLQEAGRFKVEESGRYILDLAGGFDDVWEHKFRGTARTAIRKAERSDLDVEVDRTGRLLDVFFELYEKTVPRWTSIPHEPLWLTRARANWINPTSRHHLGLVATHFGKGCATWVARATSSAPAPTPSTGGVPWTKKAPIRCEPTNGCTGSSSRRRAGRDTASTTWEGRGPVPRWRRSRKSWGRRCTLPTSCSLPTPLSRAVGSSRVPWSRR